MFDRIVWSIDRYSKMSMTRTPQADLNSFSRKQIFMDILGIVSYFIMNMYVECTL